jgi:23S rRNA (cytosine1962-C5)-methyltransferase
MPGHVQLAIKPDLLMKTLQLNKGRDTSVIRHHPWIFSGAVDKVSGNPQAGDTVTVLDAAGKALGLAAWSPSSQIRARLWTVDASQQVDAAFIRSRVQRAVQRRAHLLSAARTAVRLIYAESDGLPGLIVDRYGDFLSCQFLSTGPEFWRDTIIAALREFTPCVGIYERSDVNVRKHEGLPQQTGVLWGEEPPESVEIVEQDRIFEVNIKQGHKTGYYLDQFDNRSLVQSYCRERVGSAQAVRRVLNCFSYTGGFGVAALKGGAEHVINIDSSSPSLQVAANNLALNGFEPEQADLVQANVFEYLRELRQQEQTFDLVVLDPPKFAETKSQFLKAARAYKDITLQAAQLIATGGTLVSFSCSGAIDPALFQKITADGLLDAGREGRITHYLHQSEDHPVGLPFPESLYLKGLVCVLD